MTEVRWTTQAADDLQAIYDFIERDSPHYAQVIIEDILDAIDKLERFPLMGRPVPELPREDLRELIKPPYLCPCSRISRDRAGTRAGAQRLSHLPGISAGAETYKLRATNALGKATEQIITVTVSQPSSSGSSASPSPTACTPQSFILCLNCPNTYDSEMSSLACTEQLAKTQAEQANPGCTASVGSMQDFTVCLQCPNGEHRTITARGCTETGARANAQRQHPTECQVTSGRCP